MNSKAREQTDYSVLEKPPDFEESVIEELAVTKLIKVYLTLSCRSPSPANCTLSKQDDILIDIAIHEKNDTIAMSVESTQELMDQNHAKELIKTWTLTVERFLSREMNNF